MKPQTCTLRTLTIFALLVSLLHVAPTDARQYRTRPRRVHPPQTQQQPSKRVTSPIEAPPSQRPMSDIIYDKDKAVLDALSADDRAAVREGLEELSRAVRLYEFKGYDESFLNQVQVMAFVGKQTKLEQSVTKAYNALPASSLKQLINDAWGAFLDANLAERLYRRYGGSEELLKVADRYKLDGVPASAVGTSVFAKCAASMELALAVARKAGIVPPAPPQ